MPFSNCPMVDVFGFYIRSLLIDVFIIHDTDTVIPAFTRKGYAVVVRG